jgi:hypothetical protein
MGDITECNHDYVPGVQLHNVPLRCNSTHRSLVNSGQLLACHTIRLVPRNFDDILLADDNINPSDCSRIDTSLVTKTRNPLQHRIQPVLLMLRNSLQTAFNVFGLCHQYPRHTSFEPDKFVPSQLLA